MNRHALYIKSLKGRAEVYHFSGKLRDSTADYAKALNLARAYEDRRDVLGGMCWLYSELGDYARELSCADRLTRIVRNKDLFSRGKALIKKADALRDKGNYELSLNMAKRSIRLYRLARKGVMRNREEPQKIQLSIANAYNTMGQTYRLRGNFEPALGFFKKYLRIVEKINNQTAIVQAFNNIGLIYWHTGKFRDANDHFSRCLDIAQRIGYKSVLSTIYGNIGLIYNEIDKARTAIRYFHEAIKSGEEVGNKASVANNMNNAALCYAGAYDTGNALKYFNHSLNIFKKINNLFGIALLLNNIATIHFNNGDFQKALMHEKESEAMAKSGKMTEMIVRTWTLKARIYAAWNRHAQSMEAFKNAIALAERSKMEYLKMTAVMHCVNALIKEKNLKRLAAMSKYIIHLENSLKKESDNYYRSLVLCTLARFDLLENRNGEARKKLAILSAILKRSKDKRFIAETLIMRARLNIADGKKHAHLIMRARELAKKTGLYYLAVEIRQVVKSSKNSEESL